MCEVEEVIEVDTPALTVEILKTTIEDEVAAALVAESPDGPERKGVVAPVKRFGNSLSAYLEIVFSTAFAVTHRRSGERKIQRPVPVIAQPGAVKGWIIFVALPGIKISVPGGIGDDIFLVDEAGVKVGKPAALGWGGSDMAARLWLCILLMG